MIWQGALLGAVIGAISGHDFWAVTAIVGAFIGRFLGSLVERIAVLVELCHRHHLAGAHSQRHIFDHLAFAVGLLDVADFQPPGRCVGRCIYSAAH